MKYQVEQHRKSDHSWAPRQIAIISHAIPTSPTNLHEDGVNDEIYGAIANSSVSVGEGDFHVCAAPAESAGKGRHIYLQMQCLHNDDRVDQKSARIPYHTAFSRQIALGSFPNKECEILVLPQALLRLVAGSAQTQRITKFAPVFTTPKCISAHDVRGIRGWPLPKIVPVVLQRNPLAYSNTHIDREILFLW
ncbi:hypothetical protein BS47DRAFT_340768 [Hydnum rufescens UP504]|uniref:Uncharacterized protein n=1 Tax=Hydnum rufescens UP504 TaxID=1448309 RepID=A0A9P6AJZ1_9AGAM|nr:hypothetical protein BS47DRAFT_340768 [Hydnum rufescens UP504]